MENTESSLIKSDIVNRSTIYKTALSGEEERDWTGRSNI